MTTKNEPQILLVHLGKTDDLDETFQLMKSGGSLKLGVRPKHVSDRVLLVASAPKGNGEIYLFVGVINKVERSDNVKVLVFDKKTVTRFVCPVVAVYSEKKVRRTDLIGDVLGWGAVGIYYVAKGTVEKVEREAEKMLTCKHGARPRRAAKARKLTSSGKKP
jgi:hypothetical protein